MDVGARKSSLLTRIGTGYKYKRTELKSLSLNPPYSDWLLTMPAASADASILITFSSIFSNAATDEDESSEPTISWICCDVLALAARALSVSFLLLASASFCSSILQQSDATPQQLRAGRLPPPGRTLVSRKRGLKTGRAMGGTVT